ncbi:hypothetical protein VF14_31810 [Nostoc linckia z18]|uniref:Uncharacterized protein n=2 Tax=Nostoc linckia TaxID=92942 RepID=A0A9Q5Z5W3_NOSLI|nr:hypothetical protein [Nostoc linckia]PHK34611.1 hypothetical protein VF12_23560 [Nostoc linckia z15]PHK41174.1 hypothetical protein VF13_31665 [Nostoc linckia z16]PHJ55782.1 hypothetical protein VF02_35425 [Nostoc linckia z1]PHJ56996.1 hypothetical protein VF05_36445 [Nostoc linckia z3]PHJ58290.1 hypothetical protein VF03_35630 [Nostoc linckia z2]
MHYRLVAIGGKLYQVFAYTYKHAIAQAVGQSVAMGVTVDKNTSIELIAVDSEWLEQESFDFCGIPQRPKYLPFLESIYPSHKNLSLQAILMIYESNFDIYKINQIKTEELKFIAHLANYFKSSALIDFWF